MVFFGQTKPMIDLRQVTKQYTLSHLEESDLHPNPFKQLETWLEEAIAANIIEANAMSLATVDKKGHVSVRMVQCKYIDEEGLVFCTSYKSPKGQSLIDHPQAAIQFWWPLLERQVRIEGITEKIEAMESDKYFASRDEASQITSILSKQSEIMPDKQLFIDDYERLKNQQEASNALPLARPAHWGGFILKPTVFEFWQGGLHRLSDRLCYQPAFNTASGWKIVRLYP